jgi:DNA-binding PadR family transcriptional regulator
MVLRDLFLGFVKIHILYHAGQEPVYGLWLIEELAHHGYDISPGTLYPALKSLENEGYLLSEKRNIGGKIRKYYTLTEAGQLILDQARHQVNELANEIIEGKS